MDHSIAYARLWLFGQRRELFLFLGGSKVALRWLPFVSIQMPLLWEQSCLGLMPRMARVALMIALGGPGDHVVVVNSQDVVGGAGL